MLNVITKGKSHSELESVINAETVRKVAQVRNAHYYNIMTACVIDGEFVLVSEYDICEGVSQLLEIA